MRRLAPAPFVLAGALLAGTAVAAGPGGLYARVLHTYQARGSIPACRFTSPQLAAALGAVNTYGQQYYADFVAAIQAALAQRASGACSKAQGPPTQSSRAGSQRSVPIPSSVTASTSSGVPAPIVVLAIVAAMLGCGALVASLSNRQAGGTGRATAWRHGVVEARYRAAGAWDAILGRLRR